MAQTDPISDFLTRIRNTQRAGHGEVDVPHSGIKERLAEVLKREGFVSNVRVLGTAPKKSIRISLRYRSGKEPMIRELERVSKPGCRTYASVTELAETRGSISVLVVSTSKGLMTDREAREANIGGEVICRVS